jgi:hypothetical protein
MIPKSGNRFSDEIMVKQGASRADKQPLAGGEGGRDGGSRAQNSCAALRNRSPHGELRNDAP